MKKLMMSAVMCVALFASSSVMGQDTTSKKDCCKAKKECTKDNKKSCDKKSKDSCSKDTKKPCCTKDKK
ncbi:MAG: hypothetical protein E6767_08630 [Dysgonomonas sp.]|nr:hypothetical protein [Dysgonomonas sp.]